MLRIHSILLLMLAALSAQPASTPASLTQAGVAEFTAAYQAWDGARFAAAAELFRRASTNAPASSTNFYWLGAAQFHRLLQLQHAPANPTNKAAGEAALSTAVEALTTAVKLNARDAESHALLGTLYGMKIDGNLIRAARFGPRVNKHRELALKHGAANPRVQYLLGTCQFHTAKKPAEWRDTLKTFQIAEKLFEKEAGAPGGPTEPRWGYSTCLTFIGLTCEKLGQRTEAGAYFRKALARHPLDSVAQAGLKRAAQPQ